MANEPKPNDDNPWKAAAAVGAVGVDLAVCTVVGVLLGRYVGDQVNAPTAGTLLGAGIGLAAGIFSCILLIKRILEK